MKDWLHIQWFYSSSPAGNSGLIRWSGWDKDQMGFIIHFLIRIIGPTLLLMLTGQQLHAQAPEKSTNQLSNISGYIYNSHRAMQPVAGVRVSTSSGKYTLSDTNGFYQIQVKRSDTVWFYGGSKQAGSSFPGAYLQFYHKFNVYLEEPEFQGAFLNAGHQLSTVKVTGRNYRKDSLERRRLYGDIFNYQRPKLSDAIAISKIGNIPVPLAIGVNITVLAHFLQIKQNNKADRMKAFAEFAEDEGYIRHRLSPGYIEAITGLKDEDSIQYLRLYYRPTANQLRSMNELELGSYLLFKVHELRIGKSGPGVPSFNAYRNSLMEENAAGKSKQSRQ